MESQQDLQYSSRMQIKDLLLLVMNGASISQASITLEPSELSFLGSRAMSKSPMRGSKESLNNASFREAVRDF